MTAFDPRDPRVREDPYPAYAALRESGGLHHVASARTWFVADHDRCHAVLTDARFSAAQGQSLRVRSTPLPPTMLTSDPPEHTRLRAAGAPAFDRTALAAARQWLRPMIHARVGAALAALRDGAEVDVVGEVAEPLATAALGRFLGLAPEDTQPFARWARDVATNLDPFADPGPDSPAAIAMEAMLTHFADLMHMAPPDRHSALAVLARSHAQGSISPGEALATAGLLVVGGLDPLVAMVSGAVAALTSGRADVDASAVSGRTVVDEALRYDSPIQFTARRAVTTVDLPGARIPAGEHVVVLLGSANHDPARFERPERMILGRRPNPHLAFGAGPHRCLGAPLVRLFGELLVDAVSASHPRILVREAVRSDRVVPRRHDRLVVAEEGHP